MSDQKKPPVELPTDDNPTGTVELPTDDTPQEIPSGLDLFKGQSFLPGDMPLKRPEISGVPSRGTSITVESTPTKWPVGFHPPSISVREKPIRSGYGYGPEWDKLGIGAGIPRDEYADTVKPSYGTDEYAGKQFALNLEKLHEAPPIVPNIDKFLGNIVDPYRPGFGQNAGAKYAGIGLRGVGKLASGLTTPENLAIMAAFEGAGLGAKMAAGESEALRAAPKIAPLLKTGERVHLLEVPGLQKVARQYVEGQVIKESNKALQAGAAGYFGTESAKQVANAENPEDVVAGVLGTALGGLGVYHGVKGLYRKGTSEVPPEVPFDPKTATREDFIQEAVKRANKVPEPVVPESAIPEVVPPVSSTSNKVTFDANGKIILPQGWTARVGKVDKDQPAMARNNELVFSSQAHMDNPSVWNHEAVHAVLNGMSSDARAKLIDFYINQKASTWQKSGKSKDYMVMNNFHREDLAIDLGNYFTHPEFVSPGVSKVFDLFFPKGDVVRDRANRGEPVIVQTEGGGIKANPNLVRTEVAPIEETKPKQTPKVDRPKQAPPDRRIKITRGMHGQVDVIFPDAFHKDLFVHASRIKESSRGGRTYTNARSIEDYLAKKLGVDPQEVYKIASEYRRKTIDATKGLEEDSTFNAPKWNGGETEFHHGLVPKQKRPPQLSEEDQWAEAIRDATKLGLDSNQYPDLGNLQWAITRKVTREILRTKKNPLVDPTWKNTPDNWEPGPTGNNSYPEDAPTKKFREDMGVPEGMTVDDLLKNNKVDYHHGLIPPSKESITVRGKDVASIDAAVRAKEAEGYTAIDVSKDGGIIMSRAAKAPASPKITGPTITGVEPEIRRALEEATQGLQDLSERNRTERAIRFARARKVPATGLEGSRQVMRAMGGKYGDVTMEPLRLSPEAADKLANKIWVNTYEDMPTQLHANAALHKMLDGINPTKSEIEAFTKATGIETRDLFPQYYHGLEEGNTLPEVDVRRSIVAEVINIPRAWMSSFDLSFGGRQGITMILTKAWWKAWGESVKTVGSEKNFRALIDSIEDRPHALEFRDATGKLNPSVYERMGLDLTDLTKRREESFQSSYAEVLPGVRASSRAYTAFADKLRADNADALIMAARKIYESAYNTGKAKRGWFFSEKFKTPEEIEALNPYTNDVLLKQMGDYINAATGRGSLKIHIPGKLQPLFGTTKKGLPVTELNLEGAATLLNAFFFSPRLMMSRLQMMNPSHYVFSNPFIRKQYMKSMFGLAAYWTTMAGVAKMAGADVNLDPDNSDFLKIRVGNTRLDPGAGFQQFLVLYHRLWSGKFVSPDTKGYEMGQKYGGNTRLDILQDFAKNKFAPPAALTANFLDASKGKPFQVGDTTMRLFIPMVVQDIIETAQDNPELLPMIIPAGIAGIGVQNFGKNQSNRLLPNVWPAKNDWVIPSNARVK